MNTSRYRGCCLSVQLQVAALHILHRCTVATESCSARSVHGGVSWLRGGSGSLSILGSELLRGVSPPARLGGTAEEGTSTERQGAATAAEQGAEADKSGAGPSRAAAVPAHEAASNVSEGTLVRGDDLSSEYQADRCL